MDFQLFKLNYELKEILGHGSQSTVRRVIRRDTQQIFAAKIYQSCMVKARHEMDMLVRLDHPSIVNIYEVYEEENCIILILDFMAGGQLYDQISQRKRFTEAEVPDIQQRYEYDKARHYIRILADAVRYCHECGVIHRDIKPENLLLTTNGPDGLLKLSDFGISKILTASDQLSTICGTPIYMAPEIWKMETYNQKVDVWSIGVVAYYLLSGEYPFFGDCTQELLKSVCFKELTFKQKIWDSVSGRAVVFLREALNKDKWLRPSASDLLQNIWFIEPIPTLLTISDPNLAEAIVGISRQKLKTKKIRKQRELREIFKSSQLPQVRFKFLTFKEMQTHQPSDMESSQTGLI